MLVTKADDVSLIPWNLHDGRRFLQVVFWPPDFCHGTHTYIYTHYNNEKCNLKFLKGQTI